MLEDYPVSDTSEMLRHDSVGLIDVGFNRLRSVTKEELAGSLTVRLPRRVGQGSGVVSLIMGWRSG
jgi:hypothetical protein